MAVCLQVILWQPGLQFLYLQKQTRFCFPYQAILVLYQVERYIGKYFVNDKAHILHQMQSFFPLHQTLFFLKSDEHFLFHFAQINFLSYIWHYLSTGVKRVKVTVHFFLNHTVVMLSNNLQRRNFAKCFYIHFLD